MFSRIIKKKEPAKLPHHDDDLYSFAKYNHKQFGKHSYHGDNFFISHDDSRIGSFCSIGNNVCIGVGMHPVNWLSTHPFQYLNCFEIKPKNNFDFTAYKKCTIGNDVWIGRNAIIMDGLNVSDGAIIASGAIVTKDVPAYTIVGGIPAKPIRLRFDSEIINELLILKWWDLDDEIISTLPFNDVYKCIEMLKQIRKNETK